MFDLSKTFDLSKIFALSDTMLKSKNYCTKKTMLTQFGCKIFNLLKTVQINFSDVMIELHQALWSSLLFVRSLFFVMTEATYTFHDFMSKIKTLPSLIVMNKLKKNYTANI